MNMKEALQNIVASARKSASLDRELTRLGYHDTPYFEIFGRLADAVYALVGEETDNFCQSVAYTAITSTSLTDSQCAEMLLREQQKRILIADQRKSY